MFSKINYKENKIIIANSPLGDRGLYSFFPITTAPTIALKNKILLISNGTT